MSSTAIDTDRFWSKVDQSGECWLWTSTKLLGYGVLKVGSAKTRKAIRAHRIAYELLVGPIPEGLTLDHLCRVKHCVKVVADERGPAHIEPVTNRENVLRGTAPTAVNARKTACVHGHPFDQANTRIDRNGYRRCRACHSARSSRRRRRTRLPA